MKNLFKDKPKRVISLILASIMLLSVLIGTFAYFTDRDSKIVKGTAGTVEIEMDYSGINLLDEDGQDILNPGDGRDFNYKITNKGSKSVDIYEHIFISVYDKNGNPLTLGTNPSEFDIYEASDVSYKTGNGWVPNDGANPIVVKEQTQNTITYTRPVYTLSGSTDFPDNEREIETLSGNTLPDYHINDFKLLFDLLSPTNEFQGCIVKIDVVAEAKQHRNTDNIDWATVQTNPLIIGNGNKINVVPDIDEVPVVDFNEYDYIYVDIDYDGFADELVKAHDNDGDGFYVDENSNTYIPIGANSTGHTVFVKATHNGDGTYTGNGELYIPVDTNLDGTVNQYIKVIPSDINGIYTDKNDNLYIPSGTDANGYNIYIRLVDSKDGTYKDADKDTYIPIDSNSDTKTDSYIKASDENKDGIYEDENGNYYAPSGTNSDGNTVYDKIVPGGEYILVDTDKDGEGDTFVKAKDNNGDTIYTGEDGKSYIPVEDSTWDTFIEVKNNGDGSCTDDEGNIYVPSDDNTWKKVIFNEDGTYTDENGNIYIPVDTNGDGKTDTYIQATDLNNDGIYEDANGNTYIPVDNVFVQITKNDDNTFTDTRGNMYIETDDGFVKITDLNKDGIYEDTKGNLYIPVDTNGDGIKDEYIKAEDDDRDGIFEDENGIPYIPGALDSDGNYVYEPYTAIFTYSLDNTTQKATVTGLTKYGKTFSNVTIPSSVAEFDTDLGVKVLYAVTEIGDNALSGNTQIESITIPQTISKIGSGAFQNCSGITTISFPGNITDIPANAFKGCTKLEVINLNDASNAITVDSTAFNAPYTLDDSDGDGNINRILISSDPDGDGIYTDSFGNTYIPVDTDEDGDIDEYIKVTATDDYGIFEAEDGTLYADEDFDGIYTKYNPIFTYSVSDGITTITGLTDYGKTFTELEVPSTLGGGTVMKIGSGAFEDNATLTSIALPNTLSYIGNYAFENCISLTSIVIPENVSTLGSGAFKGCTTLASVNIPSKIKVINAWTFTDCTSLTSIVLPNGLTEIGNYAFKQSGLQSIVIPSTVKTIDEFAFQHCTDLTSAILYEGLTKINTGAFGYSGITEITIPASVTTMGTSVFNGCKSLETVVMNNNLITSTMFWGCSKLTTVTVNNGVTSIGSNAFTSCAKLEEITFDDTVATITIGTDAFPHNYYLEDSDNDGNINRIIFMINTNADGSFTDAFGNTYINVDTDEDGVVDDIIKVTKNDKGVYEDDNYNEYEDTNGDGIFTVMPEIFTYEIINNEVNITGLTDYGKTLSHLEIPETIRGNTVKTIKGFIDNTTLTSVYIPDTVHTIYTNTFNGCTNLSEVTGMKNVQYISIDAFGGCTSLTNINLPEGLLTIGQSAFMNSGLVSVTVPATVTNIGNSAFREISSLTEATVNANRIGGYMFRDCTNLTKVNINGTNVPIGDQAFYGCTKLTDVNIANSITSIGYMTFYNSGITDISLPVGLKTIGELAFYNCKSLTSNIVIPEGVTSIGTQAFYNVPITGELIIPSTVTSIGKDAFRQTKITSAVINNGMTTTNMFTSCTNLKTVTIHGNLDTIADGAFSYCTNLEQIILDDVVSSITVGNMGLYTNESGSTLYYYVFEDSDNDGNINRILRVKSTNKSTFTDIDGNIYIRVDENGDGTVDSYVKVTDNGDGTYTDESGTRYKDTDGDGIFTEYNPMFVYEVVDGNAVITDLTDYGKTFTEIEIPSTIDGYPVTEIAQFAFVDKGETGFPTGNVNTTITKITVPDSVKTIGQGAFAYLEALTDVDLGNGVQSIGMGAFLDCTALEEITFPDSVTSLGASVCQGCTALTKATLSSGLTTTGNSTFKDCTSLVDVTIPSTITKIDDYAFQNTGFTTYTVPDSITEIGSNAFSGCQNLTEITVPSTVNKIADDTFTNSTALEYIYCLEKAPTGVQPWGAPNAQVIIVADAANSTLAYSIDKSTGTATVTGINDKTTFHARVPSTVYSDGEMYTVTTLSGGDGWNNSGLKSLLVADTVTTVDAASFSSVTGLDLGTMYFEGDTIPSGASSVARSILMSTAFTYTVDSATNEATITDFRYSTVTDVVVPAELDGYKVVAIGANACKESLSDTAYIESIYIYDGITSLGDYSVAECNALTHVRLANTLKTIGAQAFYYSSYIKEINLLPDGLETIGDEAFNSALMYFTGDLVIPDSVTSVGKNAFLGCRATSLTLGTGMKEISSYAFSSMHYIETLTIPEGVTAIGTQSFGNLGNLYYGGLQINLPSTLTEIGTFAFQNANTLQSIVIPDGITILNQYVFDNCQSLSDITLPSTLKTIDNAAFRSCYALKSIIIPKSVTNIYSAAFEGCSYITFKLEGTMPSWYPWGAESASYEYLN